MVQPLTITRRQSERIHPWSGGNWVKIDNNNLAAHLSHICPRYLALHWLLLFIPSAPQLLYTTFQLEKEWMQNGTMRRVSISAGRRRRRAGYWIVDESGECGREDVGEAGWLICDGNDTVIGDRNSLFPIPCPSLFLIISTVLPFSPRSFLLLNPSFPSISPSILTVFLTNSSFQSAPPPPYAL